MNISHAMDNVDDLAGMVYPPPPPKSVQLQGHLEPQVLSASLGSVELPNVHAALSNIKVVNAVKIRMILMQFFLKISTL